jgi:hypothetical protein
MVVSCSIRCRGRYSRRDPKLDYCFFYTFPPKVGLLFFLHFPFPLVIFMACTIVSHKSETGHKCLCHPNPFVLSYLINSGFLGNKDQFSSHFSLDYSTCKLSKSKSFSFPSHN